MQNEKRLIDANALFPNGVFYVNGNDPITSIDELLNRIATAPSVDAVEVVHGRWINCGRPMNVTHWMPLPSVPKGE